MPCRSDGLDACHLGKVAYHRQLVPELRPFSGVRYDARRVPDLGAVLCPPYDVISPAERAALAARDARNAIHLELPDSYASAARLFAEWLADGTLHRDERERIYVYEQRYSMPDGEQRVARAFFCALRLEPFEPGSGVLPHELTMSGPKEDRFQLLSAVRANLSPVLFLYDDGAEGAAAHRSLETLAGRPPAAEMDGAGGTRIRVWPIDPADEPAAADLLAKASARPVNIADGHHRYETALRYRDVPGSPPGANWVLALMYEAHSGGLSLLPWHRVLSGEGAAPRIEAQLGEFFDVEPRSTADEVVRDLEAGIIGYWSNSGGGVLVARPGSVEPLLPVDASEPVRRLDVSVLSVTLSRMLGRSLADLAHEGGLAYVSDAREAISLVDSGQAGICFLLAGTPVDTVLNAAAAGDFMPAKSTFFHPKAATGVVFNLLD